MLIRYFAAKLGSPALAEDLVQELYLKLHAEPAGAVTEPKAWLYRVGANLLIDMRRSAVRSAKREQAWADIDGMASEERASPEPSAEQTVAARQRLMQLLAVVDRMPPRMAQAFRLHRLENLSQAQTADRMGISVKAVEKHLSAALQRLVIELPRTGQ